MAAGNQVKMQPQMLMVILSNRSTEIYNRVKKNADYRWGVMSECIQGSNVVKNQAQYCSKVLMKFDCRIRRGCLPVRLGMGYPGEQRCQESVPVLLKCLDEVQLQARRRVSPRAMGC